MKIHKPQIVEELQINGTTSGVVTLKSATGTYTLTLPTDDGNAGEALKTDGSGNLSWGTAGGGGITWEIITADQTADVDKGYLANKGTLLTLTLPTTSAVGKTVRIAGMNAGLWKVAQGANQYIKFGNQATTVGAGGYLSSVLTYDAVELVCIEQDLGWVVASSVGNITVV